MQLNKKVAHGAVETTPNFNKPQDELQEILSNSIYLLIKMKI